MSNVEQLPAVTQPRREIVAGAPVRAIVPSTMEDAFRIATAVVKSGMAPKDMDSPERCLVAIMQGMECGMTPMQSIQRIAVINGRPTIWGDAAIGLVRASGVCEYIQERIEGEGDKMVAICEAKRKGEKEPIIGRFSVEDAKLAGLWNKQGPWKSYPKRMLQQRARGFCLRDGFADVLGGMYLREEMEGETIDVTPVPAPPPAPPSAPTALTPPPPKEKKPPKARAKKEEATTEPSPAPDALEEIIGPMLPGDWSDYLDRMKEELASSNDKKSVVDTVADAILGALERHEISDEEAKAIEDAWAKING